MSLTSAPAPGGHTVGRWVSDPARLAPSRTAVDERGHLTTYGALDQRSTDLARALVDAGYRRGDRIATLTRNSTDHVVAFFACAKAALVLTPLSWRLPATELADLLRRARPALVLASDELAPVAGAALAALAVPEATPSERRPPGAPTPEGPPVDHHPPGGPSAGGTTVPFTTLGQEGVESSVPPRGGTEDDHGSDGPATRRVSDDRQVPAASHSHVAQVDPAPDLAARHRDDDPQAPADDDPVLLLFTSGSTGAPRGVLLTHANCYWTNASLGDATGMTSQDIVLGVMPQFHSGGWNIQPLLAWRTGATVVVEPDFDAGAVLDLLTSRRVTTMMGVPAHYRMLAEHPGFAAADLGGLTHAIVGGAHMPPDLLTVWQDRGVRIFQGYGLTEAGPNVLVLPAEEAGDHVGSVGRPYAHVEVALLRDGTVHHGAGAGELLVRGPNVFAGYADDPQTTRAAFHDGWLRTRDLAERDEDGYVRIVDRRSAMYITGGENVSPAQVEATLRTHPDVADVVVVGVPDERWGEVGHAVVVPRHGSRLTGPDVVTHVRARLAAYKAPRHVTLVEQLPKLTLLKVDRTRLPAPSGVAGAASEHWSPR